MTSQGLDGLGLELSSKCNYRCSGCPNATLPRGHGNMDPALFFDIFRQMGNEVNVISLWNYGEPLLHPHIEMMLEGVRKYRCKKMMSTNGYNLEDLKGVSFLKCLDEIRISINGLTKEIYALHQKGGDLEKVMRGVKRVTTELGSSKTKVVMLFVAHNGNLHQISELPRFARDLGFDRVLLKGFNVMDGKSETFERFVPKETKFSRYHSDGPSERPDATREVYPCKRGLMINWNGTANICCYDYKGEYLLGDASKQGILEIWNSQFARTCRKRVASGEFLDICTIDCSRSNTISEIEIK